MYGTGGKMKITCTSQLAKDLITQLNERLTKVNHIDYKNHLMEDSDEFVVHLENIKNISVMDIHGVIHKPLGTDIATKLVYDEIHYKRREEDKKNVSR